MSLYQLERQAKIDDLLKVLEESDDPTIRKRAAEILGGLAEDDDSSEAAVETLVETVRTDGHERVRGAAIDALDQHGQSALEQLVAELSDVDLDTAADWVAAKAFAEVLDANRPELRMAAATGLGRVGGSNVTPALAKRLEDPDSRVRVRSAVACGRIEDPRAVEPLERRLDDNDPDVRQAAANALGKIGTDRARSALARFADDKNESVRRIVVDALGHFGSLDPVDMLVEALDDNYEMVRRTAMFSLIEILSNAPPHQSHEVREAAAGKLESATAADVVPPLAEILYESSGAPQRRNAAWLLGRVVAGDYRETARVALIEALGDDDRTTAQFAATSLAQLDDDSLESRLLKVLEDSEASTDAKSKALFVIGKVGGQMAREELGQFVDTVDDESLREAAFSALSKLGGMDPSDIK